MHRGARAELTAPDGPEGDVMNTVARVYALAKAHGLSLYQLAQKSGISYSTIKTTEKRGGQLKIDTIERICRALEIPLSEFFAEGAE